MLLVLLNVPFIYVKNESLTLIMLYKHSFYVTSNCYPAREEKSLQRYSYCL